MATLSDIFAELLEPEQGDFSPQFAQYVLGLKFSEGQVARYADLADRNQDGKLTPEEVGELDTFVTANTFLSILKLKARRSLHQHSPAA